jgi:pyruvate dehydrogenase E1 component beta subunit
MVDTHLTDARPAARGTDARRSEQRSEPGNEPRSERHDEQRSEQRNEQRGEQRNEAAARHENARDDRASSQQETETVELNLVEAVNRALAWEMAHDERVVVLGEDVGINGGVFRSTVGLLQRFGPERVIDTPLAETAIAGVAVGMAAQGLRPVAEIQFTGFIYPTLDHMINHATRLRHRTRGRLTCPMVLRSPYGAGIHAPEHHSESPEALFAHVPGLRMVIPSSPARAYGLLLAAIRDPDPVVFFEPTRLYRLFKQRFEDDGRALPLDTCFVSREGSDITLVSWGAMLHETMAAADALAEEGVSAEVIDVATLKPLDLPTILESVTKTGRCVIVHEAARTGGYGAEIAASIGEHALTSLLAPVQRVTGYDTVVPLYRLEQQYLPSVQRIIAAARAALAWA